ncbi:hypothetical protein D1007_58426 [Hordeum vulgare]|nr:hypothetical protein D1007_58426 [Hordeum vulgare]
MTTTDTHDTSHPSMDFSSTNSEHPRRPSEPRKSKKGKASHQVGPLSRRGEPHLAADGERHIGERRPWPPPPPPTCCVVASHHRFSTVITGDPSHRNATEKGTHRNPPHRTSKHHAIGNTLPPPRKGKPAATDASQLAPNNRHSTKPMKLPATTFPEPARTCGFCGGGETRGRGA